MKQCHKHTEMKRIYNKIIQ